MRTPVNDKRIRIRELAQRSGVSRQTIHYYLREGLLQAPVDKNKNSAWYDDRHVTRLHLIRDMRENKFLPIKAIRAIIEEDREDADFSHGQRETIAAFRETLRSRDARRPYSQDLELLAAEIRFTSAEITQLKQMAWIQPQTEAGREMVDERQAQLLRAWAAVRDAGLTPRRGFTPRDFVIFDELLGELAQHQAQRIKTRLGQLDPETLESIYDRLVPALQTALGLTHAIKVEQALTE